MSAPDGLSRLGPGFDDTGRDSRSMFGVCLSAMAHPGRIHPLDLSSPKTIPAGLNRSAAALRLALLDQDTAVWPPPAARHAVLGMTRAAALDGRAHGIAVGQIDIGNAATAMTAHVEKGALQADGTMRAETRPDLLHIAASVVQAARMPPSVNMLNMTLLPTSMPFVGRG